MNHYPNRPAYQSTSWLYGYTLGPPSEEARGNYSIYHQPPPPPPGEAPRSAAPPPSTYFYRPPAPVPPPGQPTCWADVKPKVDPSSFVAKVFVTAASSTTSFVTSTSSTSDSYSDNACMQVHDLAVFNRLVEQYDQCEGVTGPDGAKTFTVTLILGNERYVASNFSSVKAAKQNAAMQAMATTSLPSRATMKPRPLGVTATSELHELAQKKGVQVEFKFLEPFNFQYSSANKLWSKEEMRGNYKVQLTVCGQEFIGNGELPQEAKHAAAMHAIPLLRSLPEPTAEGAVSTTTETGNKTAMVLTKNPIMFLNELGMSHGFTMEWIVVGEEGPPHMRVFTWKLKLGPYESVGTGASKKVAKTLAAQNMLMALPPELKELKRKGTKRKATQMMEAAAPTKLEVVSTPTVEIGPLLPKATGKGDSLTGVPVHTIVTAANPISALHEFCRKAKLSDPDIQCVSENVLKTWEKGNITFKKVEYTMRLEIMGKTYYGSANTKKLAKTAVATEAWNIIRAGIFP